LTFLGDIFRQNSNTNRQIRKILKPTLRIAQLDEKPDSVAFLPLVRLIFNRKSRGLFRHNIKSVGLPQENVNFFPSV
jgi:hypothetical protein